MARRKAILIRLIIVGLIPFAAAAEPQQEVASVESTRATRLPLAYFGPPELGDGVGEAMEAEVARILEAAGVPVELFSEEALDRGQRPSCGFLVRVVIRDHSPVSWGLPDGAMGVTMGRQMPPTNVYVFRQVVLQTLGVANDRAGYLSDAELGRAFGQVIVHELVHGFAPDHKHSGWGIMGHAQDATSLTQANRELKGRTVEALQDAWRTASRSCG